MFGRPALRLFPLIVLCLISTNGHAFEILAIGTSATNCKGVDRDKTYPARLQAILQEKGLPATVVNAAENGDWPSFMYRRLQSSLHPDTRIVILEPGPNAPDPAASREYAEKMLAYLQERGMPTIYISTTTFQTVEEARELASKYGAYYYGAYGRDVPLDHEHYQFDFNQGGKGRGGHMTAEGCAIVANNVSQLVEKVIREKGIH